MELSEKICNLRKKEGMSQEVLADKLNVSRQTISNWECGQTTPDIIQAKNLASIFNISLDELVNNDVKNILIKKIISTEKLSIKIINILKILSLAIIFIVTIFIILNIGFIITNINNFSKNNHLENENYICTLQDEQYFTRMLICSINGNYYRYDVSFNKNNEILTFGITSVLNKEGQILKEEQFKEETAPIYDREWKNVDDYIDFVKKFYEQKGGTFEEISPDNFTQKYIELSKE